MFTHPLRNAGALAFAALLMASPVLADESRLDDVVISASRLTPVADLLPVGSVILGPDELDDIPANNLADVLDTVAGINASRFYGINGAESGIDLLGFGATGTQNTLILLNGRRLNDVDLAAVDFAAIPLAAIERIEILPASGAVLYGNGAVGGAINIVTRQQHRNGAGVEALAGSYDTVGGQVYGGRQAGSQSGFASLQAFDSQGYRENNRVQQQTAYADWRVDSRDIDASLTLLADNRELELPGGRRVDPVGGSNQLRDDPTGAATPNDWADQQGLQLLPGVQVELRENLRLHVDSGWRIKQQQYFIDGGFGFTSYTEAQTVNFSLSPRLVGQLETGSFNHQWIAGLDFHETDFRRDVALNETTFSQPIHRVDIRQQSTGLYLMDSVAVTDSTLFTAGARHEWVYTRAADQYDPAAPTVPCCGDAEAEPFDISQRADIWNVGIRQNLSDTISIFANAERSARFASVDEFFELDPNLFVTSLDPLEVQTGTLYSAGARWQRQGYRAVLTAWRGNFRNEIHYDANAFENVNLDPTRRYGASLNTRWPLLETLTLTLNGSYQRAQFSKGAYEDNEVPLVPRQTAYGRLDYEPFSWLSVSLAHRYVGRRYFDNDQNNSFGGRIPSYRRSDAEIEARFADGFWLRAGVYNLEDRIVFDYGVSSSFSPGVYSAYPLPDRHLMMSLGADW